MFRARSIKHARLLIRHAEKLIRYRCDVLSEAALADIRHQIEVLERAIITLMGNRGLLLIGEPGTAKSLLSELLCASISGSSTRTVQGTAGTTEDQIKYTWNKALLFMSTVWLMGDCRI